MESLILKTLIEDKGRCRNIGCLDCPFSLKCQSKNTTYDYSISKDLYTKSIKLYSEIYGKESLMEILL